MKCPSWHEAASKGALVGVAQERDRPSAGTGRRGPQSAFRSEGSPGAGLPPTTRRGGGEMEASWEATGTGTRGVQVLGDSKGRKAWLLGGGVYKQSLDEHHCESKKHS